MENEIQLLHFGLFEEAKKLFKLVIADPCEEATLCNDEDMNNLPFKPNDLGFFMVLVRGEMQPKHGSFSYLANENMRPQAQAFLIKHNVSQLDEGILLVSTSCTWDLVPGKVKDAQALGYSAIAFSTPERLQILAENPLHIR